MKKYNTIDLFCGCGGWSNGLTKAGLNIIGAVDVWQTAVDGYNKNYDNHHKAYCRDLTTFSPEQFQELCNPDGNDVDVDVLIGSPPCQTFSMAGKRDAGDAKNDLFLEYVKYLNYFSPKAFMMENVMGMLSMKTPTNELAIDIILRHLSVNYNCIVCKLYASDFEVPQNRRRVIIMGIRKDLNILPTEPELFIKSIADRIPVKKILLPREQIDASYYLSEKAIQGIANKKKKSKEQGAGFGAQMLDFEKPSYTISARYWKDGYDALVRYTDTEIRRLTILELKRIQSFPDDYIIEGTKKDVIMQIGNAVACQFAYHMGKHIVSLLDKIPV